MKNSLEISIINQAKGIDSARKLKLTLRKITIAGNLIQIDLAIQYICILLALIYD